MVVSYIQKKKFGRYKLEYTGSQIATMIHGFYEVELRFVAEVTTNCPVMKKKSYAELEVDEEVAT